MVLLGRFFPRPVTCVVSNPSPSVCVVIVAFNEESRILSRLENIVAATYSSDKIDVLLVSDGSTDRTVEYAKKMAHPRVKIIDLATRRGKAACLNTGVAESIAEIILFADARQRFEPDTIEKLVAIFSDPRVGAASGQLSIEPATSGVGSGVDAYWRLEKTLRHAESLLDSAIGCTGAIYAIRRNLYTSIPEDTILDDVVIPMQIAVQGHRVLFVPEAVAYDPQSLEPELELVRKRRTLAGNFQVLARYPAWLLPWRNRLWWQLLSHKYLRLLAPLLLLATFLSNISLLNQSLYRWAFLGQCGFYLLACVGFLGSSLRQPVFSIPAGFVFLNLMTVSGCWHYIKGVHRHGWEVAK